jgi:pimeloyl-ACP methyl ester carboxylesterase
MSTHTLSLLADTLPLTVDVQGSGRPYLLLHGGAGPRSMAGLAQALASTSQAVLPTLPGFEGQPRPHWLHRIADLARAYLALLDYLDLRDVVVVGNSVGGWLAAELGLRASSRITGLVLLNSVGLAPTPATGDIADPTQLAPADRAAYAFYDPARFALAPAGPEAAAAMAANQQALRVYAGEPFMHDPTLRDRLPELKVPTLILWGESDRIVTPAYGQQFADFIPHARFELVPQAGHFPQIERLDAVLPHLLHFS